ncbi:substrate-binding domain-containing protein [Methylobacterium sp. Leaf123]|uniref:helix-turn-helix transcriptional regulator n=1 Tax=Methylobacterium sp. Leaf123 TaxID=1736264 RepID=UPI00190FC542|nr:substrate-binding domain-containing protein [Methylobacterium sp. Leaf123]
MIQTSDDAVISVVLGLGGTIRIGENALTVSDLTVMFDAITRTGSVQGFADALGLSYRAAWARLQAYETALGRPLVRKTRGHGTALTAFGAALADAFTAAATTLEAGLDRETRAVEHRLRRLMSGEAGALTLAASHDPLLVEVLTEAMSAEPGAGAAVELSVTGSSAAVQRLLDGGADAAGFHCGALAPEAAGAPFASINAGAGLVLHPLFEREQGLLLAPGNPRGIRTVADLTAPGLRYVNRQKGSGTRDWFDRILAQAGLPAAAIHGYTVEEFTHQAVAAVIACGAADAGLAVRAAADRLGLDFLSVGWETYYLAASRSLASPALDALVTAARRRARSTPGYRAADL